MPGAAAARPATFLVRRAGAPRCCPRPPAAAPATRERTTMPADSTPDPDDVLGVAGHMGDAMTVASDPSDPDLQAMAQNAMDRFLAQNNPGSNGPGEAL